MVDEFRKEETTNEIETELIKKLKNCIEIHEEKNERVTIVCKRNYNGKVIDKLESFMAINSNMVINNINKFRYPDKVIEDVNHIVKQLHYYEKGGYLTKQFFIIDVSKQGLISFLLNFLFLTQKCQMKKNFEGTEFDEFIKNSKSISIYILDKLLNEHINEKTLLSYLKFKSKGSKEE